MTKLVRPVGANYYSADTVAECFDGVSMDLYKALWDTIAIQKDILPIAGDGSNGTVETPDGMFPDPKNHWFDLLSEEHQSEIIKIFNNLDKEF
jgi:hypothetical protein